MFSNAKVGDKAWSVQSGWGIIYNIDKDRNYPIKFRSYTNCVFSFTYGGFNIRSDINPTLFWNEFPIPESAFTKPLPQLKVDSKVIVWNDERFKFRRHFSHFKDGIIYCFCDGTSSWNNTGASDWNNWELVDE